MNPTLGGREWALLVTLSVLWGATFYFVEIALVDLPVFTLVAARVTPAAVVLVVVVYVTGHRLPTCAGLWRAFLVMGVLNCLVPFSLIFWGQGRIEGGVAAICNAMTPLFTVVAAHFLGRDERLTAPRLVGVGLGLAGVALLVVPKVAHGAADGIGWVGAGQLAVLAGAVCYAGAAVYGRRLRALPPAICAAGQLTATALLAVPLALVFDRPWTLEPGTATVAAVAALALGGTAAGYVIYFRLLATAGATNVLLVTYLMPVTALILGAVLLAERPGWPALAGLALILAGISAIDGRMWRWPRCRAARPQLPRPSTSTMS